MSATLSPRPRVVVCGTKFGRVYLAAFRRPDCAFELAGVVARGSEQSQRCAREYGVPLFRSAAEVPDDVEIACVVVGAGPNGGPGAALAREFMVRGIHVLQEHPLHAAELAACLRCARESRVVYHLNTHHVHVEPVRTFIATCRALVAAQRPMFIDGVCAFQTAFTLLDIVGAALGRVRPWAFADPVEQTPRWRELAGSARPFRTIEGVIAGVPVTLRIQHEIDPRDPENHIHLLQQVTVGVEGGLLSLVSGFGPLLWSPRAHLPDDARRAVRIADSRAAHFDWPSVGAIGPAEAPSYRQVLASLWPEAVVRALEGLRQAIVTDEAGPARSQYYLSLCEMWRDISSRLGPVALVHREPATPLSAPELLAIAGDAMSCA